jgi:small neutral amino acid transporter SnatA (MarC family)
MKQTEVTAAGLIDTFLLLLIGVGPKLALVPFLEITAPLDSDTRNRVRNKMLRTAASAALVLVVLGEALRRLLHFTVDALSIAGGIILLVLSVRMVIGNAQSSHDVAGKDPMDLAVVPLAFPDLLNPVGIVALVTISAEAGSISVLGTEIAVLVVVLVIDVFVFRWAGHLRSLNEDRMLIVEKVFGFLIAAIAVQLMLDGLSSAGAIGSVPH